MASVHGLMASIHWWDVFGVFFGGVVLPFVLVMYILVRDPR